MQSHLHFLKLVQQELELRSRSEKFLIFNDIVWNTLLDSRDMLVIHLASWAKGLYHRRGHLTHLSENCAPQLFASRRIDRSESDLMRITLRLRRERYERLFPDAAKRGGRPTAGDVRQIVTQFKVMAAPVIDDRNDNRAHPHEPRPSAKSGKAAMLSLEAQGKFIRYAHDLFNDLQSLSSHSTTAYSARLAFADADHTAEDLVDLILFGNVNRMALLSGLSSVHHEKTGRYPWQYRDDLYEQVWSNRRSPDQPFNAPEQFLDH
jgi:hypothetical protein